MGKRRAWWGLAYLIIALLAFISRKPEQWFNPQFWGEDGRVFFAEAVSLGVASLSEPYAGYFHLVPRVVAMVASAAPWEYLPAIYMLTAALAASAVVARVAMADLPALARAVGALAMVAVPHSGEVFLNLTNLHWVLGPLLIVNLLERAPTSRGAAIRRALEIVVAGLSGPIAVCLMPFAGWWLLRYRRERLAWWPAAAWGLTVGTQLSVLLLSPRAATADVAAVFSALWWVVPRYVMALLVGEGLPYTRQAAMVVTLLAVPVVTALFWDRRNSGRMQAGLLLVAAAGLLVAGRLASPFWGNPIGGGARYAYVPFVLALWALGWIATGAVTRGTRAVALLLCGCVVLAGFSHWRAKPQSDFAWAQQVREVRAGTRTEFLVHPDWIVPVPQRKAAQ